MNQSHATAKTPAAFIMPREAGTSSSSSSSTPPDPADRSMWTSPGSIAETAPPSTTSYPVLSKEKIQNGAESFPVRLHYMINEIEKDGLSLVCSWQPHGRCFRVHSPTLFQQNIIGSWFRMSKLPSFQRQLNLYGFKRITAGPDKGAYYHVHFLRQRPDLLHRIQRFKVKGKGPRKPATPGEEPNFYAMTPMPPNPIVAAVPSASANSSYQQMANTMMTNHPLRGIYYTGGIASSEEAAKPSSFSDTTASQMISRGTSLSPYEQPQVSQNSATSTAVAGNITPEYFKTNLHLPVPAPVHQLATSGDTPAVVTREMDFLLQPPSSYPQISSGVGNSNDNQNYTVNADLLMLSGYLFS